MNQIWASWPKEACVIPFLDLQLMSISTTKRFILFPKPKVTENGISICPLSFFQKAKALGKIAREEVQLLCLIRKVESYGESIHLPKYTVPTLAGK